MRVAQTFVLALAFSSVAYAKPPLSLDRVRYQQALTALRAADYGKFRILYRDLRGYIARPYLRYHYLMDRLRHDRPRAVDAFLARYPNLPVTTKLRRAWLTFLARRHDDKEFLAAYTPAFDSDVSLHCDDLAARARAGQDVAASVQAVWLTGRSLPRSCRALTARWRHGPGAHESLVWARVKRAMRDGNAALISRLRPALTPAHALWVHRWLALAAHPAQELAHLHYPLTSRRARHMVRAAVVSLGWRSPTLAMSLWQRLRATHPVPGEDNNYVLRGLGLIAAADHLPEALPWLSSAVPHTPDGPLVRWRVRAALRERAWGDVLMFIGAMPPAMRHKQEWQYWRARALAAGGQIQAARTIFAKLAGRFSYYGFLAAGRLGQPYHIPNHPLTAPAQMLQAVERLPGVRLAHELFRLHQHREARALWFQALRGRPDNQVEAAALLASRWGWHDCAILTVAGTPARHALAVRFPLLYRSLIEADAGHNRINVAWVYGIIRQESAFIVDARSDVGALGLMQLMPQTGFMTAREIHLPIAGDRDLMGAADNVDVGTHYLADVLQGARGEEPVATAAYNAGPTAAASWLPVRRPLPADIWVDTIPYRQTRGYVKNVLAFTAIYDYLLTGRQDTLLACMKPIPPAVELAAANGG
ncbi:transglycosylase SLT domain-containing protein [Acidiferrobacter sp.]|uniref:transglycosylase SLT domain-containing protein n=1 Tax=Acidiferrobacter sp. TaxID=1872107 RepID=UPI00261F079E|nr:transglycosylase SLT domain-containing protein [Acidiferrobacter sp.]